MNEIRGNLPGKGKVFVRFGVVVWGKDYGERFVRYVLRNHASEIVLCSGLISEASTYVIYTSKEIAGQIAGLSSCKLLEEHVKFEIHVLEELSDPRKSKYELMSQAHRLEINKAVADQAVLCFLPPDALWSSGSFKFALSHILQGKTVVMIAGIRTVAEDIVGHIESIGKSDTVLDFPHDEITAMALSHLHPISKSLFWRESLFSNWPSHLYWRTRDGGVIIRAFHLHPFMVGPLLRGVDFGATVDDSLVMKCVHSRDDIFVIDDSRDAFVLEFSPRAMINNASTVNPGSRVAFTANWAAQQANELHRWYSKLEIRVHGADSKASGSASDDAVVESCRILDRIHVLLEEGMGNVFILNNIDSIYIACLGLSRRPGTPFLWLIVYGLRLVIMMRSIAERCRNVVRRFRMK